MTSDASIQERGSHVMRLKMKPALADARIDELMRNGIGVLDFGTEFSVEPDDAPDGEESGAARSFRPYLNFTRDGGYCALVDQGHDLTVVGYADGPCGMFIEEQYEERVIPEKAFQLDRFAVIEDSQENVNDLYNMLRGYDPHQTMGKITDKGNRKVLYEAFHSAERNGRVRKPA